MLVTSAQALKVWVSDVCCSAILYWHLAILVQLSEKDKIAPGEWFLEIGFDTLSSVNYLTFVDLDAAQDCISGRLTLRADAS
jgi:hypothetical protein